MEQETIPIDEEELKAELRKLNWGALLLNWIWGLGNKVYIALICLAPVVNIIFAFVLLVKGNEWAWKESKWRDLEHFRRVQKKWTLAAVAVWLAGALFTAATFFGVMAIIKSTGVYKQSLEYVTTDREVIQYLGEPMEAGFLVMGNFEVQPTSGYAGLAYNVKGPKDSARVYLYAVKKGNQWFFEQLDVSISNQNIDIDLLTE